MTKATLGRPSTWKMRIGDNRNLLVAIVLLLAVVSVGTLGACSSATSDAGSSDASESSKASDDWPTSGLAAMLPTPEGTSCDISSDDDDYFSAHVGGYDQEMYEAYAEACKDAGFTVDGDEGSSSYSAYNSDGYKLRLSFWDSDEELSISLEDPIANDPITWPKAGVGSLLPEPASLTGEVTIDMSEDFYADITNITPDDFKDYVDACMAAGFSVDYDRGDTYFYASNANGSDLMLDYVGFNTMTVDVMCDDDSPDANATGPATVNTTEESDAADADTDTQSSDSGEVTPSFKEAMDSYEEFFNQYAEFMQRYSDEGYPASMLQDYMNMLQQYNDCMEKLDAIDEDSLSAADEAYYLEVMARIEQKLLEAMS